MPTDTVTYLEDYYLPEFRKGLLDGRWAEALILTPWWVLFFLFPLAVREWVVRRYVRRHGVSYLFWKGITLKADGSFLLDPCMYRIMYGGGVRE